MTRIPRLSVLPIALALGCGVFAAGAVAAPASASEDAGAPALQPSGPASAEAPALQIAAAHPAKGNAGEGSASEAAAPAATAQKDPLLPAIMSPGEKLLWGEHGWMRSLAGLPLNEESREKEMGIRRTMLTLHQVGGYVTLASMIATAFAGQMIINGHESYEDIKAPLAWTTVGLYFTTASLALLTPPPIIRREGFSSLTIHKGLAWVHFTGMIITPILGTFIEDERKVRVFHQTSGYITTAAFAGAMLSITLF